MKIGLAALSPAFPVPRLEGGAGDVWPACGWTARAVLPSPATPYRVHPAAATWSCCPSTASTREDPDPPEALAPGWTACAARPWG